MKSIGLRFFAVLALALLALVALLGASASKSTPQHPDKLIIMSTTDVKGKTSPCG